MQWLHIKMQIETKYVQMRQLVKMEVRNEQNEHWDRLCRDIDETKQFN